MNPENEIVSLINKCKKMFNLFCSQDIMFSVEYFMHKPSTFVKAAINDYKFIIYSYTFILYSNENKRD